MRIQIFSRRFGKTTRRPRSGPMTSSNGSGEPMGYGHDQKGAAVGDAKQQGHVHVHHQTPDPEKGQGRGELVTFMLDGREVEARKEETIWQVAKRFGTDIPHLCYSPEPGYR